MPMPGVVICVRRLAGFLLGPTPRAEPSRLARHHLPAASQRREMAEQAQESCSACT
jgi:hypothetical protein